MDRKLRRFFIAFLALQLFLPVCKGLGLLMGKPFSLHLPVLLIPAMAAASLYLTKRLSREAAAYWFCLAFPAAFCNALVLLLEGILGGIAGIVCICCGWALLKGCPKGFFRGLFSLLFGLLTAGFGMILPLWGFACLMGHSRVVTKLPSPEGRYTAIVTSVDQGALGGDTLVDVRDHKETVNILLGSFVSSRRVYQGGWGAWEHLTLSWDSESVLNLNGTALPMEQEDLLPLGTIADTLGISIPEGQVLEYQDTHGGFHGDGSTFAKIQGRCQFPDSSLWHPLPAPEEIERAIALCRDREGNPRIPDIQTGYWYIWDRHPDSTDAHSNALLHSRSSWNFVLAVYDTEENLLYYFEFDT